MKRKSLKKLREYTPAKPAEKNVKQIAIADFALKTLSVLLATLTIIALTLFILGKMSTKGFYMLSALLALIAFVILPIMKKKYATN